MPSELSGIIENRSERNENIDYMVHFLEQKINQHEIQTQDPIINLKINQITTDILNLIFNFNNQQKNPRLSDQEKEAIKNQNRILITKRIQAQICRQLLCEAFTDFKDEEITLLRGSLNSNPPDGCYEKISSFIRACFRNEESRSLCAIKFIFKIEVIYSNFHCFSNKIKVENIDEIVISIGNRVLINK